MGELDWKREFFRGLKPGDFIRFIGTTEVVPFQNMGFNAVLPQPGKPAAFPGGPHPSSLSACSVLSLLAGYWLVS